MNGYVSKLYDIDSIVIPKEMLNTFVDEQRVEEAVHMLSMRYAKEMQVDIVEKGDLVYCQADQTSYPDGRTILLYTGLEIEAAKVASEAVIGKKTEDSFLTTLAQKQVGLTIKKIIRRIPVEVNDALIVDMGIEGVISVEDYKAYIRQKMAKDQKMENSKAVLRYVMDEMVEKTIYSYDEAEMQSHVQAMMAEYEQMMATFGADEMEDDESPEDIKENIIYQAKQYWMAEAFCKSKDIPIDESDIEDEINRMVEMMELTGEPVPKRDELRSMMIQDAYLDGFFGYVNQMIEQQKEGGKDGNC